MAAASSSSSSDSLPLSKLSAVVSAALRRQVGRAHARQASRLAFDVLSVSDQGVRPAFLYDCGGLTSKQLAAVLEGVSRKLEGKSVGQLLVVVTGTDSFGLEQCFIAHRERLVQYLKGLEEHKFANVGLVSIDAHFDRPRWSSADHRRSTVGEFTKLARLIVDKVSTTKSRIVMLPLSLSQWRSSPIRLSPMTIAGLLCGYPVLYSFEREDESKQGTSSNCLSMERLAFFSLERGSNQSAKAKDFKLASFSIPEALLGGEDEKIPAIVKALSSEVSLAPSSTSTSTPKTALNQGPPKQLAPEPSSSPSSFQLARLIVSFWANGSASLPAKTQVSTSTPSETQTADSIKIVATVRTLPHVMV